ncbi:sodium-independent anion transporter [Advenella faeciporci]|uniref:Sodium-independent anion transporter n=1 Tax=Advenella faeciporci TaxID=797535 RepID=A0A918N0K2_9BURK|nr:sulfate permease [Advenella faeciporci]GGW90280.1 sodium-independent anion transporter [Advenella faeciporci]
MTKRKLPHFLPDWISAYQKNLFSGDLTAGLIVTVMLIPQSLAYAMLAGLPPEMGLYASILPIIAYALLGSSMTLATGPVAVISLMTASALAPLAQPGSVQYIELAIQMALISGVMLLVFGLLRLGFLAHLLSHPVISGFISGSAILISIGQLKHMLGVQASGNNIIATLVDLARHLPQTNLATLLIGTSSLLFLWWSRRSLSTLLEKAGISSRLAGMLSKLAPMISVICFTLIVYVFKLDSQFGVSIAGHVPQGLPTLSMNLPGLDAIGALWLPALLISLVGFVESVSVAQSLALKRKERIKPNRELIGLGAANIASAISGGYPVTGGFARSVVNFSAGANTPLAGVISALLMTVVIAYFTHLFYYLPQAVLAATIISAVTALIDWRSLKTAWQYDRADAFSLLTTMLGVVFMGVEAGILLGIALSLAVLVWRSSRPHMAVLGRVPNTEHYRNIERHDVQTIPGLVALRVDESLFFANAAVVEQKIMALVNANPDVKKMLLVCSAVNQIDATALEMLDQLEKSLAARDIQLYFAEIKGPIMDRLKNTSLGRRMKNKIFLSVHAAFLHLKG